LSSEGVLAGLVGPSRTLPADLVSVIPNPTDNEANNIKLQKVNYPQKLPNVPQIDKRIWMDPTTIPLTKNAALSLNHLVCFFNTGNTDKICPNVDNLWECGKRWGDIE
jgi:hypothetical protein